VAAGVLVVLLGALSSSCGARSTLYDGVYQARDGAGDDAGLDELPPVQTTPVPDVAVSNCTDPAVLYIYLVTLQNELWTFDPKTEALGAVGALDCPTSSTPFSMAVDRQGTAYVVYRDGELFRVSTRTAACSPTSFVPPNSAYDKFGMGFVGDSNGATDTLYIATVGTPSELAILDLQPLVPAPVGELSFESAELTGTVDGRLYAFYSTGSSSAIAQLDPKTAGVVSNTNLADLPQNSGWAFGLWGGDFYLFTGSTSDPGSPSLVTRYRPSDGSQTTLMTLPQTVVGAGVSTCASQM
jgi:hypothetical protein